MALVLGGVSRIADDDGKQDLRSNECLNASARVKCQAMPGRSSVILCYERAYSTGLNGPKQAPLTEVLA